MIASAKAKTKMFDTEYLNQGSHSILKLEIEAINFVKFKDNLEKNQGESRRFFLHFQTKSRKIKHIFQSQ